ncbi:MAG: glycine betaine ABC transporter substrate-binding protein [Nocardioidaceae bacterium]
MSLLAGVLALGVTAAACGGGGGTSSSGNNGGGGGPNKSEPITIGLITWGEDIATTHLWKYILEQKGYTVKIQQLGVGPTFAGLASGDLDLFFDTWLPVTHKKYWQRYGDKLTKLTQWYGNASLHLTVPKYSPANSIADLPKYTKRFDGKITGIEAGAGEMGVVHDQVIPKYGLKDAGYTLVEGSTPAMLAALDKATSEHKPILVTLWRPHWAYSAYPIKDLKDPKGAMGATEKLYVVGPKSFPDDHPQVAKWLGNFKLNDKQLGSLENLVLNKMKDNQQQAVKKWVGQHQSLVDSWTSG